MDNADFCPGHMDVDTKPSTNFYHEYSNERHSWRIRVFVARLAGVLYPLSRFFVDGSVYNLLLTNTLS